MNEVEVFTYSVKYADEMKERIQALLNTGYQVAGFNSAITVTGEIFYSYLMIRTFEEDFHAAQFKTYWNEPK